MAINPTTGPPGAPPLPRDSVTSPHQGDSLDPIRTAIMAVQHAAELEDDDQDLAVLHKCLVALQGLLASAAKESDQAIGIGPELRHVRRVTKGRGY